MMVTQHFAYVHSGHLQVYSYLASEVLPTTHHACSRPIDVRIRMAYTFIGLFISYHNTYAIHHFVWVGYIGWGCIHAYSVALKKMEVDLAKDGSPQSQDIRPFHFSLLPQCRVTAFVYSKNYLCNNT